MKLPPESVAGALFSQDRQSILLIQRRDVPVWVLPGGGIEPPESAEEAVVREIWEETGFRTKVVRLAGVYEPMNRLARYTHLYECIILDGAAKISDETRDIGFFPLNRLPKLIPPPYPEWIADAHLVGPTIHKVLSCVKYKTLFKYSFLHPTLVLRFILARMGWAINSRS